MRVILILLVVMLNILNADAVQRVKTMISDIAKLRNDYVKIDGELSVCKIQLKDEQEKNKILIKDEKEETEVISLINQTIEKENQFPKLKMEVEYIHPSAYRINKEAPIYDDVDGVEIERWEDKTSFTSNQTTEKWIKITGYFVNKKWKKSLKNMWVKKDDATRREK